MDSPQFDVLTTTASELQRFLVDGQYTSVQLVEIYLDEIAKNNEYLKAVIATAPKEDILAKARALDEERKDGKIRSSLHGVPILVKDNVATHPDMGMDTTAGSFALKGSRPRKSASIVDRLVDAGLLIIGKANLSELSYYKGDKLLCGWSAVGGQCQPAYMTGGIQEDDSFAGHSNPGGSSAGSAVAVSAGLAPFSIGTETQGSLIMPGGRAALYTIKPTIGLVPAAGIVPISALCDSAGPMTKSVLDEANLLDVIVDPATTKVPKGGYASVMTDKWTDLKVGVLDPEHWKFADEAVKPNEGATKQMNNAFRDAYVKIKSMAKSFHENVPLPSEDDFKIGEGGDEDKKSSVSSIWTGLFAKDFESYTAGLESSPVYTLEELVEFNRKHADIELPEKYPNQKRLEEALASKASTEEIDSALAHSRKMGRTEGVDKILKEYDIDVIIGPGESFMSGVASASGYPVASLPLGYLDFNNRPFAMAALAAAHQEDVLIKVQSAWEATFPARKPPTRSNFQKSATS